LRRSCVAQGMRLVMQMRESMAGPIADLSRTYHSGTISRDHAGRFSHFNASCGVTSRCGTDGAAQIFKRNEDHREIPKNSKILSLVPINGSSINCGYIGMYSRNTWLLEIGTYEKFLEDLGGELNSPPRSSRIFHTCQFRVARCSKVRSLQISRMF